MNLSTVKWTQWDKTQSRELLVCSYVCASHCAQLLHTILHTTDLIVSPLPSRQWKLKPPGNLALLTSEGTMKTQCMTSSLSTMITNNKLWPQLNTLHIHLTLSFSAACLLLRCYVREHSCDSLAEYLLNSSGMVEINCGRVARKRQMQTCFTFFISRQHVCTYNMWCKSK